MITLLKGNGLNGLTIFYFAAFLWRRMQEAGFPVTNSTVAPSADTLKDVEKALEAAGGGRSQAL